MTRVNTYNDINETIGLQYHSETETNLMNSVRKTWHRLALIK